MSGNAHIAWVSCFNVSHICTWGREVIGLPCIVRVVISSTYVNTGVIMAASTVYIAPGWCLSAQQPQMLYKCYSHDCFSSVYCVALTIVKDSIFWTCCKNNGLFMPPFDRDIEASIWYLVFRLLSLRLLVTPFSPASLEHIWHQAVAIQLLLFGVLFSSRMWD